MSGFITMTPYKFGGRPDWRRKEYVFEGKLRQHFSHSVGTDWELTLLKALLGKMRVASCKVARWQFVLHGSEIQGCCIIGRPSSS